MIAQILFVYFSLQVVRHQSSDGFSVSLKTAASLIGQVNDSRHSLFHSLSAKVVAPYYGDPV